MTFSIKHFFFIDEMVYALYGPTYRSGRLTPWEIAIVEGEK